MADDGNSPDEAREALRESVERGEEELRLAVGDLTRAAAQTVDVGNHLAERPWTWLASGFFIGLLIGTWQR